MNKKKDDTTGGIKIISENRRARFEYHFIERFEAGIVLSGAEIKSVRQGGINIAESYVRPFQNELFLVGAHIKPYAFNADPEYDPTRFRKLLLHRREIDKLRGSIEKEGLTIIPTKIYLKGGRAKLEIALAKGKKTHDKRDDIKSKDAARQIARAMKVR